MKMFLRYFVLAPEKFQLQQQQKNLSVWVLFPTLHG